MVTTPRTPRWIGQYVIWWGETDWEFCNCVRCGEPLRSEKSKQAGYGPGCKNFVTPELVQAKLTQERELCARAVARKEPPPPPRSNARQRRYAKRHHIPVDGARKPPSGKQLRYLRKLAEQTGRTFVTPYTSAAASAEIEQLLLKLKRKK